MIVEGAAAMASAEECQQAFERLIGRLSELDPGDRDAFFNGRSFSCQVPDLDITYVTRFGPSGADPVHLAAPGDPKADVRLTASSDTVVELAGNVSAFPKAWLTGKVKVQASMRDLLRLRKLL
jgi:SCP-2 sterol transfer family protein